jgi:hypothetical protein
MSYSCAVLFPFQNCEHCRSNIRGFFSPHRLYIHIGPSPLIFSSMIILQTLGLLGRVISPSQGLYLNTGQHKHRINTYTYQTSIPCVGFEPTIPASERTKTLHALDRSATVTGIRDFTAFNYTLGTPVCMMCKFIEACTIFYKESSTLHLDIISLLKI